MSDSECSKAKRIKLDNHCSENTFQGDCAKDGSSLNCKKVESNDVSSDNSVPNEKSIPHQANHKSNQINLLSFSDDVLLLILSHLKPVDLYSVSRCCKRLQTICKDFTLWKKVDFTDDVLSAADLLSYLPFFLSSTKSIRIKGLLHDHLEQFYLAFRESSSTSKLRNLTDISTLSYKFLQCIAEKCPHLEEFSAEYCYIDAKTVRPEHFPQTLKSVSLKRSLVVNLPSDSSYFSKIDEYLPNLAVLDLSFCDWFVPHSLLAISKCNSLQELRLQGCKKMGDCVPYASLASSFGFGSLKKLDLRHTPMGDSEVSCFNKTRSLTHLYLEAVEPSATYRVTVLSDISDRTVTAFGSRGRVMIDPSQMTVRGSLLPLMGISYGNDLYGTRIQVLVIRNFQSVTDISLKHAAKCMQSLEYLDITGCGCTPEGIKQFKLDRPKVVLKHTAFDEEEKVL